MSHNDDTTSEEDVEGNNDDGRCIFDEETTMSCMANLEKINFKETTSKKLMRYHFFYCSLWFIFYNWCGCQHRFSGRKSKVVKDVNDKTIQQTFVFHQ